MDEKVETSEKVEPAKVTEKAAKVKVKATAKVEATKSPEATGKVAVEKVEVVEKTDVEKVEATGESENAAAEKTGAGGKTVEKTKTTPVIAKPAGERILNLPSGWMPKTELGREVASGKITSIREIYDSGRKILEPEIIDVLLPDLQEEVVDVKSTQRMTAYGRKMQMRAVVIIGNQTGFIGVGAGKASETRDAIAEAIRDAKKNLIGVKFGCGSWECACGGVHSLPTETFGKSSSTKITLKPAPKGVGIVAGASARKVLELAGLKDVWSFSSGRTRNVLNMIQAVVVALNKLNHMKQGNKS